MPNVTRVKVSLRPGAVNEAVTVAAADGMAVLQSQASVSVSRSVVDARRNTFVGRSGSTLLTTPRLRQYFPETLVWQPSLETDKRGRKNQFQTCRQYYDLETRRGRFD